MKFVYSAVLMLASATAPAAAADLILNGGFEADAPNSPTISNWNIALGAGDSIGLINGQGYASCCGGYGSPASLANQFASFGAGEQGVDGILSQTFNTAAGTYSVSFDAGAFGGNQTVTGTAVDTVTNLVLGTLTVTRPGTSDFDAIFATSSFSFLSVGNAVKLSFTATGSNTGSADAFVDNVSVIGAAVPEPATWAMLLAGFGATGVVIRRRRMAVRFA